MAPSCLRCCFLETTRAAFMCSCILYYILAFSTTMNLGSPVLGQTNIISVNQLGIPSSMAERCMTNGVLTQPIRVNSCNPNPTSSACTCNIGNPDPICICNEGRITSYTYSPIVTGFTCQTNANGQYTYQDKFEGFDRYMNSRGIKLFRPIPGPSNTYMFSGLTVINLLNPSLGRTYTFAADAGGIPSRVAERCVSGFNIVTCPYRDNLFRPNPVSTVCMCDIGWTPLGVIEWKYKSLVGISACLNCSAFSNSLIASGACICNAGYTGSGGLCAACGAPENGSAVCLGCPAFSDSPNASTALAACQCKSGYIGADGSTCTSCPPNSDSPAGSTAVTAFSCNAG